MGMASRVFHGGTPGGPLGSSPNLSFGSFPNSFPISFSRFLLDYSLGIPPWLPSVADPWGTLFF